MAIHPMFGTVWLCLIAMILARRHRISLTVDGQEEGRILENHSSSSLDVNITGFPALCAPEIVEESCVLLNKGGDTGKVLEEDVAVFANSMTYVSQMLRMLSADDKSMRAVLREMKKAGDASVGELLEAMKAKQGNMDLAVNCAHICEAVTRHIASFSALPPTSDVGCYDDADGSVKCDLDLSPVALKSLVQMRGSLPNFHEGEPAIDKEDEALVEMELQLDEKIESTPAISGVEAVHEPSQLSYSTREFLRRLANIFRIYPLPDVSFSTGEASSTLANASGNVASNGSLARVGVARRTLPTGWEELAAENGRKYYYHPEHGSQWAFPEVLPAGWEEMKTKTGKTYYWHPEHGSQWARPVAEVSSDEDDDDPASWPLPPGWTEKVDRNGRKYYSHPTHGNQWDRPGWVKPADSKWKPQTQKRSLQAQAYINSAIRQHQAEKSVELQVKWFGNSITSKDGSSELRRVLNSVERMLGNVEYVYPGSSCEPRTYAYVYPHGDESKNARGQYIFYLCDLYMKEPVSVQVETLTHEGSHHASGFTSDVCLDEFKIGGYKAEYMEIPRRKLNGVVGSRYYYTDKQRGRLLVLIMLVKPHSVVVRVNPPDDCQNPAYGRKACAELATLSPIKAIRNADNFCYYVQDITDENASQGA